MNRSAEILRAHLQIAADVAGDDFPDEAQFRHWVGAALRGAASQANGCVTVRLVSAAESRRLNEGFRGRPEPTNVLAFTSGPALMPLPEQGEAEPELGDLIICLAVARREAAEQDKELVAHLAHLTVHGTLHLLGYDHTNDADAATMEGLEKTVMGDLGLPDPYQKDAGI